MAVDGLRYISTLSELGLSPPFQLLTEDQDRSEYRARAAIDQTQQLPHKPNLHSYGRFWRGYEAMKNQVTVIGVVRQGF